VTWEFRRALPRGWKMERESGSRSDWWYYTQAVESCYSLWYNRAIHSSIFSGEIGGPGLLNSDNRSCVMRYHTDTFLHFTTAGLVSPSSSRDFKIQQPAVLPRLIFTIPALGSILSEHRNPVTVTPKSGYTHRHTKRSCSFPNHTRSIRLTGA
jgi:hypothetical protein